jgi:hypothetical protein
MPHRALAAFTLLVNAGLLAGNPPLPDPAALMQEVKAHQKRMDEVRENYTFHRTIQVDELDGKGIVKKTTLQEREIFFVNGHQISRLVKKDGKPLSADEEKKEQERTRKHTVEASNQAAAFGSGGGVSVIAFILAEAEVSSPRRTELNGRPTLAFDFKGNPKAEAHGLAANGAKKAAGTVWIDEADRLVAELDVEFYDDFHIGGGLLASIHKGSVMKIRQSLIAPGLWMQTSNEQHMNVRVVAMGVHENRTVKSFDFKRFNVDATEH